MSADNGIQDVVKRLELQVENEAKANKSFNIVAGIFVAFIALYLVWLSSAIGTLMHPAGLAEAAAGAALEAAPALSANMRELVVDGAPNLAQAASKAAVDMVPAYREALEAEMRPVIDEVSAVIAGAAIQKMAESGGDAGDDSALQEAADAAVARLDTILDEAMDEPMGPDEPTPRQVIHKSLGQLETVDRGLKRLARGGGDEAERELVFAWLNVLQQHNEELDKALADEYRENGQTP
jgi:hypothetical protein